MRPVKFFCFVFVFFVGGGGAFLSFPLSFNVCNIFSKLPPSVLKFLNSFLSFAGDPYRVVCYFTNWSGYRKSEGKYVPENLDPSLCTHVVFAFASLDPNDLKIVPGDPIADVDNRKEFLMLERLYLIHFIVALIYYLSAQQTS